MTEFAKRYPEFAEAILNLQNELAAAKRPADEIVWDDSRLQKEMQVSKRTTATWREAGLITYSKVGGRIYYKLSDVLRMLDDNKVPAIQEQLKLKTK